MASTPKRVAERLTQSIRKYRRILQNARDRDVNESDTVTIITDMLADVFGYDKYAEITSEKAIRGTYCDLAIEVKGEVKYLIEVKAIGLNLKENHLRQAVNYGARHGIPWVILTNGICWEVYRIHFGRPVEHQQLCAFNVTELSARSSAAHNLLYILCKEGISKDAIGDYHEHVRNVNKFMIGAALQTDACISLVRRELRRIAPKVRVNKEEIERILLADVLKRDVVEGDAPKKAAARIKKAAATALRKKRPTKKSTNSNSSTS